MNDDIRPEIDRTNLDDPDAYYGFRSGLEGGGGIRRHFDKLHEEGKASEQAERERLRDVRGMAEVLKIRPHEQPEASNREAYEWVEKRTRELQALGYTLFEATDIARNEDVAGREKVEGVTPCTGDETCEGECCNKVTSAMLQRQGLQVKGGGNRSGRFRRDRPKKPRGLPYQTIEDEPRSERVYARITPSTLAQLEEISEEEGLNAAALLAGIARLREEGDVGSLFAVMKLQHAAPRRKAS